MDKAQKRRDFLHRLAVSIMALITLGVVFRSRKTRLEKPAEMQDTKPGENQNTGPGESQSAVAATRDASGDAFHKALKENRQMPRDLVMQMLDQKVNSYMQLSHHCAQSSFMALKEQFALNGDEVAKALTPMPGLAERGLTCGALSGPLLAMRLIYGRTIHQLDQWDRYQASLEPAGLFVDRFRQEFGTTLCHQVQEAQFGRCYQLTDPEELARFQNDGATEQCSAVVRRAVRLAAGVILDDTDLG